MNGYEPNSRAGRFQQADRQEDMGNLQKALSALMIDKERLENDMRKVAQKARSRQQLDQKRELEIELDLVNRNV